MQTGPEIRAGARSWRRRLRARILGSSLPLAFLFGGAGAWGSEITFSPAPPVAGQPFTVTFHATTFGCEEEGILEVESAAFQVIRLRVTPPGCPILPCCTIEYTASATVDPLPAGVYAVRVEEGFGGVEEEYIEIVEPPACNATETSLCLGGARYAVTGEWTDFSGHQGVALAAPDDFDGLGDWGVLWFFSPGNPEMVVKILDGCALNGHRWVFLSPASTVAYTIRVRDVRTGEVKVYGNALGAVPELEPDTSAFACESSG